MESLLLRLFLCLIIIIPLVSCAAEGEFCYCTPSLMTELLTKCYQTYRTTFLEIMCQSASSTLFNTANKFYTMAYRRDRDTAVSLVLISYWWYKVVSITAVFTALSVLHYQTFLYLRVCMYTDQATRLRRHLRTCRKLRTMTMRISAPQL